MQTNQPKPQTIDEYIAGYPPDVQAILQQIRAIVGDVAPDAREKIGYGLPTFTLGGRNLVHFGAFKQHIGFYPAPSGLDQFSEELARYAGAKGSVRFPLDQPIPYDLIRKITAFRVEEERARAAAKGKAAGG